MTNLYFKNNKVLPKHKIKTYKDWKELEYNIPYNNKKRIQLRAMILKNYLIRWWHTL